MRRGLLVANWKLELGLGESVALARQLADQFPEGSLSDDAPELVVCPSPVSLAAVEEELRGSDVLLGAQDSFWEDRGAYTGQVSPADLKELDCRYCLVGHSERRELGESDLDVSRKVEGLRRSGIVPVLCVGESERDQRSGKRDEVVTEQLRLALPEAGSGRLVVAYEPIWAIGSRQPARPEDAAETADLIRATVRGMFGETVAEENLSILYGGSVDQSNLADFLRVTGVEGALIGGASLKAESLLEMFRLFG